MHSQNFKIEPSRICYMPSLLPDELFYSFLGRLLACNALHDPRAYLEQLFDTKDIIPSIDLPTRLELFHSRLGHFSPWDHVESIIETATLYPYHRPFLTIERHKLVQKIILTGGGKGLKTLLGRVANRFGANPPLRFCPKCINEDTLRHGVSFWHRNHQLPGVTCCVSHRINLVVHASLSMPITTDKRRLILPPGHLEKEAATVVASESQVQFAILANELLLAGLPALNLVFRQKSYRESIKKMGFFSERKGIDYAALAVAVRSHYTDFEEFTHQERLLATEKNPLSWLRTVIDKPLRSSHPICHLLLIGFLFGTVDRFKLSLSLSDEIGENCTLVPNRVTSSSSALYRHIQHDQLLHDTSLSCREIAKYLNLSTTTIVLRRRALGIKISERRKYLSEEKLASICAALENGMQLSLIARQHRVSISTVYRLRAQVPGLLESHTKVQHHLEGVERRRVCQQAILNHSNLGLFAVRNAAADTYAWLYRNDRDWLMSINATMRKPCTRNLRVDWAIRDAELCHRLEQYVILLKSNAHRSRISKTLLLRGLGDAMIRANSLHLPCLLRQLEKLIESPQAFQIFRIDRAIHQLVAQGLLLKCWRIQRVAGIRHLSQSLLAYIENRITELSRKKLNYVQ